MLNPLVGTAMQRKRADGNAPFFCSVVQLMGCGYSAEPVGATPALVHCPVWPCAVHTDVLHGLVRLRAHAGWLAGWLAGCLQALVPLLAEDEQEVVAACWEALGAVTASIPKEMQPSFVRCLKVRQAAAGVGQWSQDLARAAALEGGWLVGVRLVVLLFGRGRSNHNCVWAESLNGSFCLHT